jgi:hypothetical protein
MSSQSWNLWPFQVDSSEFEKIQIQQIMTAPQSNNRYFGCKCLKEYSSSCGTVTVEELNVRPRFRPFSTHSFVYCQYTYTICQADSFALPEQDATLSNNLLGLCNFEWQMLSILCILSNASELWMPHKNISYLHSYTQYCTHFTCILSKFYTKFNVNSGVQIKIIHCSMYNMDTKTHFCNSLQVNDASA